MNETIRIREQIAQDVFDYQQLTGCLLGYSKPRDKIGRLLASGDIVRIRKGLYAFAEPYRRGLIVREWLANLLYGPSYVSLDYALSYYGLIPERVETVTSVTTGRSRRFDTPFGRFTYRQISEKRFAVGATQVTGEGNAFLMASPEKALVDKVWTDNRFRCTGIAPCRVYLEEDLRIDPASLSLLDTDRLTRVVEAYGSPKVAVLAQCLRSLKEVRHA